MNGIYDYDTQSIIVSIFIDVWKMKEKKTSLLHNLPSAVKKYINVDVLMFDGRSGRRRLGLKI